MVAYLREMKVAVLAMLIVAGICVQAKRAEAAGTRILTVAGGCFWCVEADFEKVRGVQEVVSGFTGGHTENPTYREVTRGGTGHYEAVQIHYDPAQISRAQLLHLFLRSVDPTDAGGQFCDRGDSYRTAIFAPDTATRNKAEAAIAAAQADLGQAVVTPVLPKTDFWPADESHQDYYKSSRIVLTRFGPLTQARAYERYREACGRDARVLELWGEAAPFAAGS